MYEIFGRRREDGPVDGAWFLREVVHPDYRAGLQRAIASTISRGDPFDFEGMICLPDKKLRWIEMRGQLQPEIDGRPAEILGTRSFGTSLNSDAVRRYFEKAPSASGNSRPSSNHRMM